MVCRAEGCPSAEEPEMRAGKGHRELSSLVRPIPVCPRGEVVMVYTRGSITKWSRLAGACALVALIVPDGAYRRALLSIAGVLVVIAATRVPRQAWGTHKVTLVALGSAVAALWAAELLGLNPTATAWTVGVTGGVFIALIVFSAVRLVRRRKNGAQGV